MFAVFSCIRHYFGSIFHFPATFFHEISENVFPACIGSTILNIDTKHLLWKISFFRRRNGPGKAHFNNDFRPYRSAVQSFPFYPLHAPQAGPQKSPQICVLLGQVASLDDSNHVSDIILMTSSCIRAYFGNLLTYPTWFWPHVLHFGNILSLFFWKCTPRLHRKHNSRWRHKAFLIKNHTFSTSKLLGSLNRKLSLAVSWRLDPSKSNGETQRFLTVSFFGPNKPPHEAITFTI